MRERPAGDSFAEAPLTVGSREWEEAVEARCQQAGLTSRQREVVLLWAAGAPYTKIMTALNLSRRELRLALTQACERFQATFPDFYAAGDEFPRQLILCSANRRADDPRPAGVRGVTPDWRTLPRYPAVRMVSADDVRLEQAADVCVRLWLREVIPGEALTI